MENKLKNGDIELNAAVILSRATVLTPMNEQSAEASYNFQALSLKKSFKRSELVLADIALEQSKATVAQSSSSARLVGCLVAIVIHAAILYLIAYVYPVPELLPNSANPITVSIISQVVPEVKSELEVVPIVNKPVIKPKKIVKKILPVESPTQPVYETVIEKVEQKESPIEEMVAPAVEKSVDKSVTVEEKVELPKFGVAYLNNPPPEYPRIAKRAGEEGRVLLKVLVSVQGMAETVSLDKSSGYERLDHAAIEAVTRWKFVPARKGGQALSAYVIVPIKFSLDD